MKKKAAVAGGIILVTFLALIFLSRTIYFYSIPVVTAASVSQGKLRKTETAKGVVAWAEQKEMYAPAGGKVVELFVEEGDAVTAGQDIARLEFDEKDVQEQIAQLDVDRTRIEMSVETLHSRIARAERDIAALQNEAYAADEVSDRDIRNLQGKIASKKDDVAEKETLFAAGVATAKEVETAQAELAGLEEDLAEAQKAYADSARKSGDDFDKKLKDRATQVENLQYDIQGYEQDLRGKDLDLQENAAKRARLAAQLETFETSQFIRAEADGQITTLNMQEGKKISADEHIATFGIGGEYLLECEIALENNFVMVGDECTISNTNHSYRVQVSKLVVREGKKHVTIRLTAAGIEVGETFDIMFRKDSAQSYTILPNAALNEDSAGNFVYVVRTRKGILGDEYYVEKQSVQVGDSDGTNTVITRGADFFDPIVTLSDKPFDDNSTVKLKNEGDFIVQ